MPDVTDMPEVDGWPEVAQLGGPAVTASPPVPATPARKARPSLPMPGETGGPSPLMSGPGLEPERPAERAGVMVCRDPGCRAEIRMALTEGKVKPTPVDADPVPDGNLVWRREGGRPDGAWRMHVVRKNEHVDPGERRFRSHWETCASPDAFRRREAKHDPAAGAVAVLELVGLHPEPVVDKRPPPGRRTPVRPAEPVGELVTLVTDDPAPGLAEIGAGQPEAERTCGQCGTVCPAWMPALWGATPVLLDTECGMYDQLAVRVGDGWRVRPAGRLEDGLPYWNRRGTHHCPTYSRTCITPDHEGRPASLTAGGAFCRECLASRESRRDP